MNNISKIAYDALMKITNGAFVNLPQLAITGLLNDFQYVWLKRLKVTRINFEMLDVARLICNSENKNVFKETNCKSKEEIRCKIQKYLLENVKNDNRVITSLRYDKKQINAHWIPLEEYLRLEKNDEVK
jgi:hypothetical protein